MHPNQELLESFYSAFQRGDGAAMAKHYDPDGHFSDPVFTDLSGTQAGAMWQMLCGRATDLKVEFRDIEVDDDSGQAHWEAHYTFTATGRKVHNRIDASFKFRDGKIVEHRDVFDFWAWSRMALGMPGVLLGWTPLIRGKVQRTARAELDKYMQKHDLG